jgi:hypothetical protein
MPYDHSSRETRNERTQLNSGEPCALKGASTVRRGAVGKVPARQLANSLPYLSELTEARGALGLPIERDLYYEPRTLGELEKQHRTERGGM